MNNGEANYWEKVSRALDVRIRAPSTVKIGNASFVADAHFLDFGGQHGMLVFHEFSDFQTQSQLLVDKGYGVTSFAAPNDSETLDMPSWRETLADWCWTGNEVDRPNWLDKFGG